MHCRGNRLSLIIIGRTDKERVEIIKNAEESLVAELLGVLDNFELSLKYTKDDGVKMIYSELDSILEKHGLKPIDVNCKLTQKYMKHN